MSDAKKMKSIVLVTGNKNKLAEFKQLLGDDFPHEVTCKDIDLPEYQGSPEEVAESKCKLAAKQIQGPCLTEDTSLCFNALGGLPGPYIKWFVKELGPAGLYKMLAGFEDKTATAKCIFAYSSGEPDAEVKLFTGKIDGTIVEPRGSTDFCWDACFQPEECDQTYAQMSKEEKNSISHRFEAMQSLKKFFTQENVDVDGDKS